MGLEIKSLTLKNNKTYTVRGNRDRIFSPEEWKTFYDALKEYQRLGYKLLLLTGTRINELRNVKVNDIDFVNQRMVIRITKGRLDPKTNVKKSKTRTIRISKELCKDLKKYINDNNLNNESYIYTLSTPGANLCLKRTLQTIKISDWQMFSIHNIRKTAETWALAIGIDAMVLSKRFGHNIMTMYEHYSQSDAYTYKEKDAIREIYGDTFAN